MSRGLIGRINYPLKADDEAASAFPHQTEPRHRTFYGANNKVKKSWLSTNVTLTCHIFTIYEATVLLLPHRYS